MRGSQQALTGTAMAMNLDFFTSVSTSTLPASVRKLPSPLAAALAESALLRKAGGLLGGCCCRAVRAACLARRSSMRRQS